MISRPGPLSFFRYSLSQTSTAAVPPREGSAILSAYLISSVTSTESHQTREKLQDQILLTRPGTRKKELKDTSSMCHSQLIEWNCIEPVSLLRPPQNMQVIISMTGSKKSECFHNVPNLDIDMHIFIVYLPRRIKKTLVLWKNSIINVSLNLQMTNECFAIKKRRTIKITFGYSMYLTITT